MLPLWGWVLLWLVLVAVSTAVLAWRVRWLWGRFHALLAELERAGAVLDLLEDRTGALAGAPASGPGADTGTPGSRPAPAPHTSVLGDRGQLRADRLALRERTRTARRARRAARVAAAPLSVEALLRGTGPPPATAGAREPGVH